LLRRPREPELLASTCSYKIKGFIETSFIDWPGRLTAVLFLPGCNFRCPYCHNADLVLGGHGLPTWHLSSILERLKQLRGWVDGVCISGGEPTLQSYLPEIFALLKNQGLKTKLDTNGSNPEMLEGLMDEGLVDYVAMDVKAPLNRFAYAQCTGVIPRLENIRKSIHILMKGNIPYQLRTTILPRLHSIEDILRLAEQLRGAMDYKLQNFNPGRTLDRSFQDESPYDYTTFCELQRRSQNIVSLSGLPLAVAGRGLEVRLQA